MTQKEQAKAHYFDLVDYFTAKIKAQDYVIKDTGEISLDIIIDGFFHFNLWPGSTPDRMAISEGLTPSSLHFFFKESDKPEIWRQVTQTIKEAKRDRLIKELNEIMDVENTLKND